MIDKSTFESIKARYGFWSSWAIWSEAGEAPKSNVGDLSVFETDTILKDLNPEVILVGLNISRGSIKQRLANFHDARAEATDFKIRYALIGSRLWGGYMTDIIKDYDEKASGKVASFLRANSAFEESNVNIFREELELLGSVDPTIIAFGNDAYAILSRHFGTKYRLLKIPHYANYSSKELYREQVKLAQLGQ